METKNHLDLARCLMAEDWFRAGPVGRVLFALGSIYPDINLFTYFRGHTYAGAQRIMAHTIRQLAGRADFSALDYWRLGVLLHYVADIFTASHSDGFTGGVWAHRQYEKHLRSRFRAHLSRLPKPKLKLPQPLRRPRRGHRDPLAYLRDKYSEYREQRPHPGRDCAYIAGVCRELARAVKTGPRMIAE